MARLTSIRAEFVEYIPDKGELGVIYVSQRFRTAMHLCCCGCGMEVVTPLNAAKWSMTQQGGRVSIWPSVGNWSFPCQSHYWIDAGRVRWARPMTVEQIQRVRGLDATAAWREFEAPLESPGSTPGRRGRLAAVMHWLRRLFD